MMLARAQSTAAFCPWSFGSVMNESSNVSFLPCFLMHVFTVGLYMRTESSGLTASALVTILMAADISKAPYYLQTPFTNFNYLSLLKLCEEVRQAGILLSSFYRQGEKSLRQANIFK